MAKRKTRPRTSKSAINASLAASNIHGNDSSPSRILSHPSQSTTTPKRIAIAHSKHSSTTVPIQNSECNISLTLGDRFHGLPVELRQEIFAFLLVRGLKWDLEHQHSCPKRDHSIDLTPALNNRQESCVRCDRYHWIPHWRSSRPPWRNPWRSQWAPEQTNPLLCSDCWDENFREEVTGRAMPRTKGLLPCLCARRQNLEVRLVCRQWNSEAGQVFYARNTFAFESSSVFVNFVSNVPGYWRERVGKVSLMAHQNASLNHDERDPEWESSKKIARVWPALRRLTALRYLELDAVFLTRADAVRSMVRLGMLNLRQVCFTLRMPTVRPAIDISTYTRIWSRYQTPTLLVGSLAEEVARAIKGQRCAWLKRPGAVEATVERQWILQKELCYDQNWNGEVIEYHDTDEWVRLFWQAQGDHRPAYLANRTEEQILMRTGRWREWVGGGAAYHCLKAM